MSNLWRNWYNKFLHFLTPKDMSKKDDQIKFHATSTGRLYIKEEEFFRTSKVRNLINKLLGSSIYKDLKQGHHPKISAD